MAQRRQQARGGRKTTKRRAPAKREAETTDEERLREAMRDLDAQRPEAEELAGESEYSLEAAHQDERGFSRRMRRGEYATEDPEGTMSAYDMARHYLEGATQARHEDDEGVEPVIVSPEGE